MRYLFVALILFLGGCSLKEYQHSATKLIILKTPKIRFNDIGYIRYGDNNAVELELYMAGEVVNRFRIDHLVCVKDKGCITKSMFNTQYLNGAYPTSLLQNILLAKPIYNGKALEKKGSMFVQRIVSDDVHIIYRVSQHQIYFKDKFNHILIKIKDIQNGK